jgi:L-threonylcarbamoyladenylate synthase
MGTRKVRVSVIEFISKLVKWDDLCMTIAKSDTEKLIKRAAQALKDGHLVAFPTETVYGLGADATNKKAISRIYSVKGRPTDHPLIVHISSIRNLDKWARDIPEFALRLAREFWPGPMTLILKRSQLAKDFITGGQEKVGIRVPNHPEAQTLLSEFEKLGGLGVAAPSANRFGAVSPTTAEAVDEEIGRYLHSNDLIIDGGQSFIGVESTIIDCSSNYLSILRPGAVTHKMIQNVIGVETQVNLGKVEVKASGLLESHYSPNAKVVLDEVAKPGDGFIALSEVRTPVGAIRLSSPETIEQFAKDLYRALRSGDQKMLKRIVVLSPIGEGLASAIRDRLHKSASG